MLSFSSHAANHALGKSVSLDTCTQTGYHALRSFSRAPVETQPQKKVRIEQHVILIQTSRHVSILVIVPPLSSCHLLVQ